MTLHKLKLREENDNLQQALNIIICHLDPSQTIINAPSRNPESTKALRHKIDIMTKWRENRQLKRPTFPKPSTDASTRLHQQTSDIKGITGEFDGTQTDSDDLLSKWTALIHIGHSLHYQETDYITSLLAMCKGAPLKQLLELIRLNYSLDDILHFLETVYIIPKPASTIRNAGANIICQPGKYVHAFAARLELAIELTRPAYPEMSDSGFQEHKHLEIKQRLLDSTRPDIKRDVLHKEEGSIHDNGTPWQLVNIIQHITKLEKRLPIEDSQQQVHETYQDSEDTTMSVYSTSGSSDIDSDLDSESPSWIEVETPEPLSYNNPSNTMNYNHLETHDHQSH
jgi:hypothetical protein